MASPRINHWFAQCGSIAGLIILLAGCGERLEGVYDSVSPLSQLEMPQFPAIPGQSPQMQATMQQYQTQLNSQLKQVQEMQKVRLAFSGSKAWFGTAAIVGEYSYEVEGNTIRLIQNSGGARVILPMTRNPDGSIDYATVRFVRVDQRK